MWKHLQKKTYRTVVPICTTEFWDIYGPNGQFSIKDSSLTLLNSSACTNKWCCIKKKKNKKKHWLSYHTYHTYHKIKHKHHFLMHGTAFTPAYLHRRYHLTPAYLYHRYHHTITYLYHRYHHTLTYLYHHTLTYLYHRYHHTLTYLYHRYHHTLTYLYHHTLTYLYHRYHHTLTYLYHRYHHILAYLYHRYHQFKFFHFFVNAVLRLGWHSMAETCLDDPNLHILTYFNLFCFLLFWFYGHTCTISITFLCMVLPPPQPTCTASTIPPQLTCTTGIIPPHPTCTTSTTFFVCPFLDFFVWSHTIVVLLCLVPVVNNVEKVVPLTVFGTEIAKM